MLGSPARRRRDWQSTLAVVVGAGAALVGGAGVAVAVAVNLSGGGPQPEAALPAEVFAVARLDLDPSGSQKLAALALAERFPDLSVGEADDLQDDLLRELLPEDGRGDYDRQVRPWIGARAAVAGAPDLDGDGTPEALVAVEYEDRAAAERLLPGLVADLADGTPVHYAFSSRHPYVLFAGSQEAADAAAAPARVLADVAAFRDDLASLDGDQIAVAWADVGAAWAAVPAELREQATTVYGGEVTPTGRFVTGVHLEPDLVEVTGRSVGLDLGNPALTAYALGAERGTGLVGELPSGAVAAMSVAGLGAQIGQLVDLFAASGVAGEDRAGALSGLEDTLGVRVPEDLALLLGDETALGVYAGDGEPEFGARSRGDDPAGALAVAKRLLTSIAEQARPGAYTREQCEAEGFGPCDDVPREADLPPAEPVDAGAVGALPDGIAYGTSAAVLDRVTREGGLGDGDVFRRAVPDADDAASVVFADVQAARALFTGEGGDAGADPDALEPLEAFGATSTGGPDGRFRVRLTLR